MSYSEKISKLTVRIECQEENGISVGTGFWFGFRLDEQNILPVLVTNKHVVDSAISVSLKVSCKIGNEENQMGEIDAKREHFIFHPDNDIDLCVLPVANILAELRNNDIIVEPYFFTDQLFLKDKSITPIEDVFMTGYPNGLWDNVNNRPITRKGITASSPKENWQGRPVFMIDMACFGGSSGSPVYILNEGSFMHEGHLVTGERLIFLGILYAGPTLNAQGNLEIVDIPTSTKMIVNTELMMNIGIVIHASKLNDFKPLLQN
ncbi:trypsin-like peptidase domain-containing protein [Rosenbergiella epipactidis]|uniref:S1 family peptidase n=1 Tax=Rosenbergiella epipactidis TaxID=1544694 RepID=UPI001BD993C6|nr:serine protease [Rosenbergiella epipactidis]MBT0716874.1 trypsin-like peptidase domain-containing protein [Rosenbergiella epipactidis]